MDENELTELLRSPESQRVERKPSLAQSDSVRKAVCAFANDLQGIGRPGVILIGLNDDGTPSGLTVSDKLNRQLADMRSDGNILPMPRLDIETRTVRGAEVAVVIVHPSEAPPVRYRSEIYVRVGASNRIASESEIRILNERRRARDLPFDLHAFPAANLEDLDLNWFANEYLPASVGADELTANERTGAQRLASLRFCTPGDGPVPTVLGVLACGYDPRSYFPGAYVQFLRFDGRELTDPIKDDKEISGRMAAVLDELDDVLKAHISTAVDFTGADRERRSPDYPLVALQQIARNAVLHRTYEATNAPARINWFADRIEILSPGGPYGQVTPENFGRPGVTDYRNPHLAEVLHNLGYVQRFGHGIQIARKSLQDNGNPDLEFSVELSHVMATIWRRR